MCRRLAPARLGKDMSAHLPAPRAVPCQSGSLAMHLCSSCCPLLMRRTQAEPQRQAHACAPPSISCSARPTLDCLLCSSAAAAATASARSCSRSSAVSQGCAATSLRCTCSVTSAGRSSCSNIEQTHWHHAGPSQNASAAICLTPGTDRTATQQIAVVQLCDTGI